MLSYPKVGSIMTNRRAFLQRAMLATGAGGPLFSPGLWPVQAQEKNAQPKRIVFFLQNHGFCPDHAIPNGIKVDEKRLDKVIDVSMASHELPKYIEPLTPYKDRLTILQGLNGKHIQPYHGAPFGALGGFKKSNSAPVGETIDCALSRALPAVVPLLALGWESMAKMQGSPIAYASSAWGQNKAAPLYCDPMLAFNNLFGVARPGKAREEFEADTELYDFVKQDAQHMHDRLSGAEREKFSPYLEGFQEAGQRRRKLLAMADQLAKHAPEVTEKFTKPRFETDWWEAGLEVAIRALVARVTNVVTIASGLCSAGGSWIGLGLKHQGHSLGHTKQTVNPDWLKLRRYNMELLVCMIKALEAIPEGNGNMMDNTLIVYTSCHAEAQHSRGNRWPFLLIGNLGGSLKSGRYIHYPIEPQKQSRTVNALYCSLLHAIEAPRDRFNLVGSLKSLDRAGPLTEIMN